MVVAFWLLAVRAVVRNSPFLTNTTANKSRPRPRLTTLQGSDGTNCFVAALFVWGNKLEPNWPQSQLASPPAPLQGERGVVCLVCYVVIVKQSWMWKTTSASKTNKSPLCVRVYWCHAMRILRSSNNNFQKQFCLAIMDWPLNRGSSSSLLFSFVSGEDNKFMSLPVGGVNLACTSLATPTSSLF